MYQVTYQVWVINSDVLGSFLGFLGRYGASARFYRYTVCPKMETSLRTYDVRTSWLLAETKPDFLRPLTPSFFFFFFFFRFSEFSDQNADKRADGSYNYPAARESEPAVATAIAYRYQSRAEV